MPLTTSKAINQVLSRGIVEILPSPRLFLKALKTKKLKIYFGIDPTSPNIHLGHAVILRKLREFQKLGHEIIILFGTFTAMIGDPSGRERARLPLRPQEIKTNMATYKKQIAKILDIQKTRFVYNHLWLAKLTFPELIKIAANFTVSQLLERHMFQERLKKGREIWLPEFLYPVMQGYDSVALDVDAEIGGQDQTFNMLVGRKLQKIYRDKEKFVITCPLLLGLDGRKMSKSFNNTISLSDPPNEMYGKIMSLRDELILSYFELCTDKSQKEIKTLKTNLEKASINPMQAKKELAFEIVKIYHGLDFAKKASQEFEKVFVQKSAPSKIPKIELKAKRMPLVDLLVKSGLVSSKSEAKRVTKQGGVKINQIVQQNWDKEIEIKKEIILQVGKRKFVKILARTTN